MSFQDIFKSGLLENSIAISMFDMVMVVILAFLIGLFIFLIYKKTYTGIMYSASFGLSLIAMVMITSLLILAVTSNIILSLGMVGALSIVRFRTAIKDPMDIIFLFWAIAVGIILAAGFIPLAVFGSLMIGIVLLIFANYKSFDKPYILVIHADDISIEKEIELYLKNNTKKAILKSKSISKDILELNYEISLQSEDYSFVEDIAKMENISEAILVAYNGDYMN